MSSSSSLETLITPGRLRAQFIKAKDLAEQVFAHQVPQGLQVLATDKSYYTDHGIGHIQRIISKLEALDSLLINKRINEKEAFVLLVATYYHDIGLFLGRREKEDPEQTRAEHHKRSAEVIQMLNDKNHLDISPLELDIIKKVIEAHRVIDLRQITESQRIEGTEIRTRLLGAFLRIADSCDCDRSRASRAIFDLFYQYIPESSKQYWQIHFPVTDVNFRPDRASIVFSIALDRDLKEKIENYRFGNLLKKKLMH